MRDLFLAVLDSRFLTRVGNLRTLFALAVFGVVAVISLALVAVSVLPGRLLVPLVAFVIWLAVVTIIFAAWRRNLARDTSSASAIAGQGSSRWYAHSAGSPWPFGIERAVVECAVAAESLEQELQVRGEEWFTRALAEWIAETDDLLVSADAGDLLAAFRADDVRHPGDVTEQLNYLRRQQTLLRRAFERLHDG